LFNEECWCTTWNEINTQILDGNTLLQMMASNSNRLGFDIGLETSVRPQGRVAEKIGSQAFFSPSAAGILAPGWNAYISTIPNIRLGVAVTLSFNGKDIMNNPLTSAQIKNVVLDNLAAPLAEILSTKFQYPAPVPTTIDVTELIGNYSTSIANIPLFTSVLTLDSQRIMNFESPLGSFTLSWIQLVKDSNENNNFVFLLPVGNGCQDGTLVATLSNQHASLTIPFTYPGAIGTLTTANAIKIA